MDGRSLVGFIVVMYIAIFVLARCDIASARGSGESQHVSETPCDA